MRQSHKTILTWIFLLGLFGFLWKAFGGTVSLTPAKMAWVLGGCAAWTAVLLTPLLVLVATGRVGVERSLSRNPFVWIAAGELIGGLALGVPHALLARDAGPLLLIGPSLVGTLFGTIGLRVWLEGKRRRLLLSTLRRERSRTAADAAIAHAAKTRDATVRNEIAVTLLDAGFAQDAVAMLVAMPDLNSAQRAVVAGNLAMAHLHLGDIAGAREAIADAPVPEIPSVQLWRRIVDARIAAHDSQGIAALAILDALPPGPHAPHDQAIAIARAHALAARGDREGARALLRGRDDLRVIADGNGPAAPIAAELLADTAQPFR